MSTQTPEKNTKKHTSKPDDDRWNSAFKSIVAGNAAVAFFSVLLAVIVGSLMIMFTDDRVRETFGYITARPSDFFSASWDAIWGAYTSLFKGAIYNTGRPGGPPLDFATKIRPL